MKLRAPAVPLITIDPYFSVWSCRNTLNEAATCHWTGHCNTINGMLMIDGEPWRFMGGEEAGGKPMKQLSLDITALATTYVFEAAGVRLTARFFSPLFPDDPALMSRPVSYLELSAEPTDGQTHSLLARILASEELCLDSAREVPVSLSPVFCGRELSCVRMGSTTQPVLKTAGDDVRIDWGYFYLAVRGGQTGSCVILDETYVTAEAELNPSALFLFAYDDIFGIEYFHKPLKALWKYDGKTIDRAIADAAAEYSSLTQREHELTCDLRTRAEKAGGEIYAEMLTLAFRQVIAAHKLVRDDTDGLLFISKECFSNGCAATADVSYPGMPMLLLYNPELVLGTLRPILRYAASEDWPLEFAPHDVGCYPQLNGQFYCAHDNANLQMPIEECGNMLVMMAAAVLAGADTALFRQYRALFAGWADYLAAHGDDPADQNCSDDFFRHLAHNCNLSLKAIMGVESMGILLDRVGESDSAQHYHETARTMARSWVTRASKGDGSFRLAFDQPRTFSLKYNIVWDKLFGTGLFTPGELHDEFASYAQYMNRYGVPLDNRGSTSKTDWLAWTGVLAEDAREFEAFMLPVWRFFDETEERVPMADWHSTKTAKRFYQQNRSVQGGLFIRLLEEEGTCRVSK